MTHPKAFPKLNWSYREVRKRGHSSREQEVSFRYQQTLLPSTNISRAHFTPVVNIRGRFPSQAQHQQVAQRLRLSKVASTLQRGNVGAPRATCTEIPWLQDQRPGVSDPVFSYSTCALCRLRGGAGAGPGRRARPAPPSVLPWLPAPHGQMLTCPFLPTTPPDTTVSDLPGSPAP